MESLSILAIWMSVIALACQQLTRFVATQAIIRLIGLISVVLGVVALVGMILRSSTTFELLVVTVVLFGLINGLRLVTLRQSVPYVRERVPVDALGLTAMLILGWTLTALAEQEPRLELALGALAAWLILGFSLTTLLSVVRGRLLFRPPTGANQASGKLPTLTLAIPARDETTQLVDTLNSALSLDYDKLEILVFDDFSHDETPKILGDFARKGVRFVRGTKAAKGWLGKNYAYKVLSEEASGDYIIFCGADIRFGRLTPRHLVRYMVSKKIDMVSLMPLQEMRVNSLRYQWQLLMPKLLRRTPPVLGSAWMIRREALKKLGGLDGLQTAVVPERYLARTLAPLGKYRFFFGHGSLHVTSVKSYSEQSVTQVRLYYPLLRRSLAWSCVLFLYFTFAMILPMVAVPACVAFELNEVWFVLAAAGLINLLAVTVATLSTVDRKNWAWQWALPIVVLHEAELLLRSVLQYEFSEVWWKGRNVASTVLGGRARS